MENPKSLIERLSKIDDRDMELNVESIPKDGGTDWDVATYLRQNVKAITDDIKSIKPEVTTVLTEDQQAQVDKLGEQLNRLGNLQNSWDSGRIRPVVNYFQTRNEELLGRIGRKLADAEGIEHQQTRRDRVDSVLRDIRGYRANNKWLAEAREKASHRRE